MWMCHSVTHFCVFPLNFHLLFSEILKLQIYLKVKSVWKGLSIFKLALHTHAYSYSHTYTIHSGMLSRVFVVNINMRDLWIFWAVQFECVSGEAWRWEGGRILVIGNTLVDDRVDGIWHFLHRNSGHQWHWHSLLFGHTSMRYEKWENFKLVEYSGRMMSIISQKKYSSLHELNYNRRPMTGTFIKYIYKSE